MGTIEATTGLGIEIISDAVAKRQKKGRAFEVEPEVREQAYQIIGQSIEMLEVIAQRSTMAQKGLTLLRKLKQVWRAEKLEDCELFPSLPGDIYELAADQRQNQEMGLDAGTMQQQGDYLRQPEYAMSPQDVLLLGEWAHGGDMSWFFQDDLFTTKFGNFPVDTQGAIKISRMRYEKTMRVEIIDRFITWDNDFYYLP